MLLIRVIALLLVTLCAQAEDYAIPFLSVQDRMLYIPFIRTENVGAWGVTMKCDLEFKSCSIVNYQQICKEGVTHFSPSLCYLNNK